MLQQLKLYVPKNISSHQTLEKTQKHVPKFLKEAFKLCNLWINFFHFVILKPDLGDAVCLNSFPFKVKTHLNLLFSICQDILCH